MVSSKESEINELKIELQKNQDNLLALQLTTEKKTSQDFGVQFPDFTVPTTGECGIISFTTCET